MSRFKADLAWAEQTRETPPTQEWSSASPPPRYWWGANVDRLYWHFPLTQVNGSQHGAAPLQVPFCGTHETFALAVGATSDDITGTATAEVIPTRLSNCRRVRPAAEAGGVTLSCNRWSLPSCSRAYQTTWSSTGEVASVVTSRAISETLRSPSQHFQTSAATRFKQCAVSHSRSYTSVSSPSSRTTSWFWRASGPFRPGRSFISAPKEGRDTQSRVPLSGYSTVKLTDLGARTAWRTTLLVAAANLTRHARCS